jgi:hypothetical protein
MWLLVHYICSNDFNCHKCNKYQTKASLVSADHNVLIPFYLPVLPFDPAPLLWFIELELLLLLLLLKLLLLCFTKLNYGG